MKRGFLLLFIVFRTFNAMSQDLIVTTEGDSLNCMILKETPEAIHFAYQHDLEIIETTLERTKIRTKQLNFFPRSQIPKDWKSGIDDKKTFQISVNAGFSQGIAKLAEGIPPELTGYYNGLKSGYNIGVEIIWFTGERTAFGFKYQSFNSANNISNVHYVDPYGRSQLGSMSDKIKVSFVGPLFSNRYPAGKGQNSFFTNYSAGAIFYKDNAEMGSEFLITGTTFGLGLDGGYDLELSSNLSIGFQASLLAGVLKKAKISDGHNIQSITLEEGNYESLYRVDISVAIRFR